MRIGLLADAHGNGEAFDLAVAELWRGGAERLFFLGDAVGYLPGRAVIARLAELEIECVMGNHEAELLAGSVDREEIYRLAQTEAMLSADDRALIERWPHRLDIDAPCGRLVMVHGAPDDPLYGYVHPDTELVELEGAAPTTVFMGATHRPFVRRAGSTTFVNVGSCGLPRDCGELGSAAIFDDETGVATIVRFDIAGATEAALERCGPVAETVLEVFRRTGDCFGDLP